MPVPLRIALTVDPEIPVPPTHYGGIERIVAMLIEEYVARGHEVHLFAHPDSRTPATLVPYQGSRSGSAHDTLQHAMQVLAYVRRHKLDVIHSFGRLLYLFPLLPTRLPKIQSYQRHIARRSVRFGDALARGSLRFTACSQSCADTARGAGGIWQIIPNGVPLERYHFRPTVPPDAPLVFLGRVERIKGAHTAIRVAQASGRRLLIAGNHATSGPEALYFRQEILPHCDGSQIRYVGPVDDSQKDDLLGQSAAFLFPIEWEEPFGIVMAEALACGTPIIALARGSVPEVVQPRETGFTCQNADEMISAVQRLDTVDRAACRQAAERRFSATVIANQYEALYRQMAQRRNNG